MLGVAWLDKTETRKVTDLTDYTGKKLALILIGTDAKGEEEWTVFYGTGGRQEPEVYIEQR